MERKLKQRICIEFYLKLAEFPLKMIFVKDAQKSQRTDENVQKITDLIKENPRTTLLELEQDTGISKTTIGRIDMLEMTRTDPEWKDKIITGYETWVYGYDPEIKHQSAEWRCQDIAPNDFFLFPKLKAVLKGRHFDTRDDIIEKSPLALKSIPKEAYKNCFDNWEKRWRWKAFDTVPHSILWKKLYNPDISYQFISTIRSYYEQATIAIRWKGSFTESIKINSGVLQGEPLSPLLFILFITDLIEIYNNSDLPSVNLPEFGDIHLLLYADDIAIIGESRMNLQKKIKILKEYLDENLMTLNESKSKIMVFRNGGKPSNKDRWFWNDKPITITSRYTYLGFPLTPTITTTHPANYFKGKALTAINATHPILIKSKAKSINLSTKLFDTIVRAVLMYAAPLWATEHKDLLDSIQDIFIRRFLNLPRYTPGYLIRLETGRISLSVTALKLTLKYWLRVLNMSSDRLPRICFNRTRELSNASGTPIGFIKKITNLLNNNGSPALVSCDDPETLRSAITGLLKTAADQSIQNDLTRMDKSKLYSHYKDIHISFMTEGYLLGDFPFPVVRLLAQMGHAMDEAPFGPSSCFKNRSRRNVRCLGECHTTGRLVTSCSMKIYVTKGTANKDIYFRECLKKKLLWFIRKHDVPTLVWSDLAPAHYARDTLKFLDDDVSKELNPPNVRRPIEYY
ncbi:hypothetical protein LAZ67_10001831 [Cordylochernes scorpioides]|uniref:Reverse transcriptase domain-containing protein n=1 Tax=Cordylochernes scorpioides TaxID=51811 RepID=A0ABY6KW60_9ARAC|nr:hypothetical protein LAZ67_10001831 [Cordylochernes scorpioides]